MVDAGGVWLAENCHAANKIFDVLLAKFLIKYHSSDQDDRE